LNLAAGFVTSSGKKSVNLALNNAHGDKVYLQSTCYPQGKGKENLYGSPFSITIGFPLNLSMQTVHRKVAQQKLLYEMIGLGFLDHFKNDGEIIVEDLFGYSEYLTTMINGGKNVAKIAYSKAHLLLLQHQDVHAKVSELLKCANISNFMIQNLILIHYHELTSVLSSQRLDFCEISGKIRRQ
jgi:hypothetical protein